MSVREYERDRVNKCTPTDNTQCDSRHARTARTTHARSWSRKFEVSWNQLYKITVNYACTEHERAKIKGAIFKFPFIFCSSRLELGEEE